MAKRHVTRRKGARTTTGKPARSAKTTRRTKKPSRSAKAAPPPQAAAGPVRLAEPSRREGARSVPANFHALYDRGFRSSRGLAAPPTARALTPSARRLAREVKDLEVHYDQTTQLPNMIISKSRVAPLARERAARPPRTPEGAVADFIRSRGDLWQLSPEDTATIEVVSVSQPRGDATPRPRGARAGARAAASSTFNIAKLKTVNLLQRVDGKEVFNSDTTAAVNANNEVISVSGQFFPVRLPGPHGRRTAAARSGAGAANLAPRRGGGGAGRVRPHERRPTRAPTSRARSILPTAARIGSMNTRRGRVTRVRRFERPVRVKDVMFPLGEGQFVPGYYMELWIKDFPAFSYVMDAVDTPDVLFRKNLTSHVAFQYRVHNTGDALFRPHDGPAPGTPHPTGVPDGFQATTVGREADHDREPAARRSVAAGRRDDDGRQQLHRLRRSRRPRADSARATCSGRSARRGRSTTPTITARAQPTPPICRTAWSACSST